jgi:sialate O-acetylesterase
MVVQRDAPIPIWGWAAPGTIVSVRLRNRSARTTADATGRWKLILPAIPAGGPDTLVARAGSDRVERSDVMVGDVWVASGQSNMELTVAQAKRAAEEIAAADDSLIRQFKVPVAWDYEPAADLAGGEWTPADARHVGAFTAVGYFFARQLRRSEGVPIGIVNSSWGGSAIETWMSRGASGLSDRAVAEMRRAEQVHLDSIRGALRATLGELPDTDPGLRDGRAPWADPSLSDTGWREISVPGYWESQGYPGVDGIAWYRTELSLTDAEARGGVTLSLAAVDDDDITWVNGIEVGRTNGYNVRRSYPVPASTLRAGRNSIAIRVADHGGGGGVNGAVTLSFGDGTTRSLAGRWRFRVGAVSFAADGQRINKLPTVAYNRMIAPLLPFPITGVIWYQGESNANDQRQASAYREQFATLIDSWRREWTSARPPFPFLWVQLPNFGAVDTVTPVPAASAWATQRESMDAALARPNTGRAVTIDVGEANDIHPRDKRTVGERLAAVALATVYGRTVTASGPAYRSHVVRDGRVVVSLDHVGAALASNAADSLTVGAFVIAGADRRFVRANARIVGREVEVWSDAVREPAAVRYAWANNPSGPLLYNRDGLPAAPFRTDRW